MRHYTPSSEIQRGAEEALRNIARKAAWDRRRAYYANTNVVKFPRRQRQNVGSDLPDGPEAA